MVEILDSQVDLPCPECAVSVRVRLRDIQRRRTVRCRRGHTIQLREQGGELAKVDRGMKDLERSLERLSRTN